MLHGLAWDKIDTSQLLRYYGTAAPPGAQAADVRDARKEGWLPGFEEKPMRQPDVSVSKKTN
jgi:hypothetical protein